LKNIDIIIPAIFKTLTLIESKFRLLNTDWYPVFLNKTRIEAMGYRIRFLNIFDLHKCKLSDTVIIDIRIKKNLVKKSNATQKEKENIIINFLSHIKKNTKSLILFDNLDSTSMLFYVLPYVDFYYKKQLLKDKSLYGKALFGNRLFTDYYNKKYNIGKGDYSPQKNLKNNKLHIYLRNKHKIGISWNILLAVNNFQSNLSRIEYILRKSLALKYGEVGGDKKYIISANYFKDYRKTIISFQRKKMHKFLSDHQLAENFSLGIVPKKEYLTNMSESKFVVSPFGWGEICYRDYETFMAGAALIKPDMSHLETWPDLYIPDETYFPISWDIEKWKDEFNNILSDESSRKKIAEEGQKRFKNLWDENGMKYFSERFIKLINI
jgi:hypothetical protein